MKKIIFIMVVCLFAYGTQIDKETGLKIDKGWDLVVGNCSACHSLSLVTNQKGSKDDWRDMIRWMQESQGLWEFDKSDEEMILDYLAKNYPNEYNTRKRIPLKALEAK